MKFGIIGAMQEEVIVLKDLLADMREEERAAYHYYIGKIGQHTVYLCQSGIGKACAASQTTALIERYDVDAIINFGIAGGVGADTEICDTVISDQVVYHDVDFSQFNYAKGQIPEHDLYFKADSNLIQKCQQVALEFKDITTARTGLICSGDQFISSLDTVNSIKALFPQVRAVECESAPVGHICSRYNKPFLIIRTISDMADDKSVDASVKNVGEAVKVGTKIVYNLVKEY